MLFPVRIMYVSWRFAWDPAFQHDSASLDFDEERGDVRIDFLLNGGSPPPDTEGVLGVCGKPLRAACEDEAEDRWPGNGDYFWPWAEVKALLDGPADKEDDDNSDDPDSSGGSAADDQPDSPI